MNSQTPRNAELNSSPERRTALISAGVTDKIDIRKLATLKRSMV